MKWLLALLLLPVASASAAVPPDLRQRIDASCVRCHNEDNVLDLRTLPDEKDARTWMKMLELVDAQRMPPPAKTGPIEARFPLDPAARQALVRDFETVLGAAANPSLHAQHINGRVWSSIVREVAEPVLGKEALGAILASGAQPRSVEEMSINPIGQYAIDERSLAVCDAIVDAEMKRPRAERTLLVALPDAKRALQPRAAATLLRPFLMATYGMPPSSSELAEAARLLDQLRRWGQSPREAWSTLCASHLAGPKLFFQGYVRRGSP